MPPTSTAPPAHYFQASPVRGQLEPHESGTRTGWRYIQCTDTPNELKVLLPPRTALLYSQLLQMEKDELAYGPSASWKRIMAIRHLKDRMIRKCQRLANTNPAQAPTLSFRTVYAPPDFRLKEMERWLKDQGAKIGKPDLTQQEKAPRVSQGDGRRDSKRMSMRTTTTTPVWDQQQRLSAPEPPLVPPSVFPLSPTSSSDAGSDAAHNQRFMTAHSDRLSPVLEPTRTYTPIPDPSAQFHPGMQQQYTDNAPTQYANIQPQHSGHLRPQYTGNTVPLPGTVRSPEPLPHPYHHPPATMDASGFPTQMPIAEPQMNMPAPQPTGESMQPQGGPGDDDASIVSRPGLTRRRSSLKRSGSLGRMSYVSQAKNVAWAMDQSQFELAAREVELADQERQEIRGIFKERLEEITGQRLKMNESLTWLRGQLDKLQLEENALLEQEAALGQFEIQLEEKNRMLRAKVNNVLEETKRVVQQLHGKPNVTAPM